MGSMRPVSLGLPQGHLLLVVTGALAARRAPDLVEVVRGWYPDTTVRVLVTESATHFVTTVLLRVASHQRVIGPGWFEGHDLAVPHRQLAEWADAVLVYPASGTTIGKLAAGIGDSLALATVQDAECPVIIAPGVSPGLSRRQIFQENIERLRNSGGYIVLDPVPGRAASDGSIGPCAPPPDAELMMAVARAMRDQANTEGQHEL